MTLAAVGGSTNAVVHLLAIAGRLGVDLTLDDFDRTGAGVPLLVDLTRTSATAPTALSWGYRSSAGLRSATPGASRCRSASPASSPTR
ncbi:dihydroxy-acid dehydratase [Nonomuraea sp. NBC_00507]|uniref:dihydroxy-acid dehydratase domain-containing protein n=1 Tax=Nonomuraea sp. NBC_00507 TaxID=2976002 RepID=UPI002E17AD98